MTAGRERDLELGAHAVGAGDQARVFEPRGAREQPAEAADARQHLGAQRARANGLIRSTSASPASMSTPASR